MMKPVRTAALLALGLALVGCPKKDSGKQPTAPTGGATTATGKELRLGFVRKKFTGSVRT